MARPWAALLLALATPPLELAAGKTIWEVGKPQGHVEILDHVPPPREFFFDYMENRGGPFEGEGKPVLFRGAAKAMPAYQLWTDDYLREKHGKVKMDQVEPEKKETRKPLPFEDWNLEKFLDNYLAKNIYSTSATPKALGKEVYMLPPMNCGGHTRKLQQTVTWMSSGGTKSVIHNDGNHNFHCMFAGSKNWVMWQPSVNLRQKKYGWVNVEEDDSDDPAFEGAYGAYVGRIDVDNVDLNKFPAYDKLKWWNMTLNAGDCAYIPWGWYHHVEGAPQRSISTHIWFQKPDKFDQKSCDDLVAKGHDLSDYLLTIGDCSWGFGEKRDRTKCKIRSPPIKANARKDEL